MSLTDAVHSHYFGILYIAPSVLHYVKKYIKVLSRIKMAFFYTAATGKKKEKKENASG